MTRSSQQTMDLRNLVKATQKTRPWVLPNEERVVNYHEFYFIQISLIKRNHFPDIRFGL